ncbi:MAG TPA: ABC transporter ATP-binding protein [Allosphingosinicella sp.]|nr:ABC transporter ATP-binding protein [Allosphingosinicella sp.]
MLIEVQDLLVIRGRTRSVDGISMIIPGAGWLGVIGANGSGKTSLLRTIAGRLELDAGRILADGTDRSRDRAWRAQAIGFAPDVASLPESISSAELFAILTRGGGGARADHLEGLRRALEFDHFADRRIGSLSAGMRQRIAIFCAFLNGNEVIFLDEPFNWLDPVCAFDTKEALGALVRDEKIVLATALHDMSTLTHYCDSGVLLADGKVSRLLAGEDLARGAKDHAAFEADIVRNLRSGRPRR